MMKRYLFAIPAAMFAMAAAANAEEPGMLHFLNGDVLPGKLRTLDREHIIWDSSALEAPASFITGQIRDLRIPPRIHMPDSSAGHEATVTLTNGNTVKGQLASVSNSEIILDTWFAGRLVFRRPMVRELSIREMPEYLYRGPQDIDSWIQSVDPPAWSMNESGGLTAIRPGSIAKDIPLPDEFTLEFEAQWQGSFRLNVTLFSDQPHSEAPDNGYEIVFQRQSVHIRRAGERQWIGHSNRAIELQQNEKARIRIRASARTGQFAFYVNDRIIDAWTDAGIDPENLGSALHFATRDNSPVTISRVDISRWNGVLEENPDERINVGGLGMRGMRVQWMDEVEELIDDEDAAGDGMMLLRNGDRIQGTVKSIENGMIMIETPYRDVALPVERLRTLSLAPVDLEEPKLENGDVRAWFNEGGSIVFRLEGVTDDGASIQGYSQTFGNAVFDLSAFNRVEFNIYDLFREDP